MISKPKSITTRVASRVVEYDAAVAPFYKEEGNAEGKAGTTRASCYVHWHHGIRVAMSFVSNNVTFLVGRPLIDVMLFLCIVGLSYIVLLISVN